MGPGRPAAGCEHKPVSQTNPRPGAAPSPRSERIRSKSLAPTTSTRMSSQAVQNHRRWRTVSP
eukprot:6811163-Pyramimonas_sp.AAC.1